MSAALHSYRAHGLGFASEIELPELLSFDGEPDVTIRYGTPDTALQGEITRGPGYLAAKGHCVLNVRGVAQYSVRGGRDVRVAPVPGAAAEMVRVFLLSSVMAAIAHQRGSLAMHASAIEAGGQAILLGGVSGAGKSTLTAALHDLGHRIIGDDVSIVRFDDAGNPAVHHGHLHLKLDAVTRDRAGRSLGAGMPRGGTSKLIFRTPDPAAAAALPVSRVYVLTRGSAPDVALTPLRGGAKVLALRRASYRFRMLGALQERPAHFHQCGALAHRVPVVQIDRPLDLDRLGELTHAIAEDLRLAGTTP